MIGIIVSVFGLFVILRMLWTGAASADARSITKMEQPEFYWSIVVLSIIIDVVFFMIAFGLFSIDRFR